MITSHLMATNIFLCKILFAATMFREFIFQTIPLSLVRRTPASLAIIAPAAMSHKLLSKPI